MNFKINNSMKKQCLGILGIMGLTAISTISFAKESTTVFAAASLTNAMQDIEKLYEQTYKTDVKTSFAGSSTLAKQIEAGAPVDIFMSADLQWMDYLQKQGQVSRKNRVNLLGNSLVWIAPKQQKTKLDVKKGAVPDLVKNSRICTGNTSSVPVGKYAKSALTSLDWWTTVQPKLVETEDVRGALTFVERGECQLGIVYATDAAISDKVKVVGTFPVGSYPAVVYPVAKLDQSTETQRMYQFIQSKKAEAIFKKYGFIPLHPTAKRK